MCYVVNQSALLCIFYKVGFDMFCHCTFVVSDLCSHWQLCWAATQLWCKCHMSQLQWSSLLYMKRRLHWKRRRASARSVSFASKCFSHLVHSSPINDVKFIVTLRRANLSHYHCLVVTFQKPMSGSHLSSMPWSVQLTSPCLPPSFERWFVINLRS